MSQEPAVRGLSIEQLECKLDVAYNWSYEHARKDLRDLYEKAKRAQWIPDDTLPWDTDVDPERKNAPDELFPLFGSDLYARLGEREKKQLQVDVSAWTMSQFLHGEQGALLATAQLVASVPDIDSKLYGGTQVVDEARHVEVYDRYLHQKIGYRFPVNEHLRTLLDLILKDSRWDMKFLGMQIIVEGLAMSAFSMIQQNTYEPLLKELTRYVMRDEARHVAYGILSLTGYYRQCSESEVREREDFVYEACRLMRDRFLFQEVWDKAGLPKEECMHITMHNHGQRMFRQLLFSKIVPAVKRIGLLSDRQRARFADLGILQYESWGDPLADVDATAAA
jgi:hypothetical protein